MLFYLHLASVPFLHVKVEKRFPFTFHSTKSNLCHVKPKSNLLQRGKFHEKLLKIIHLFRASTFLFHHSFKSLNTAELLSSSNVETFEMF